ncbi:hypothetical protein Aperf_G00000076905 [Anoplocephala perfoliata]
MLSCTSSEADDLIELKSQLVGRSKRSLSAALMGHLHRWQAERDHAEGIDRPLSLRVPRFPVRATTSSSKISEASSAASEMPLESCIVEEYFSQESKSNPGSQNVSSEGGDTENVSMVPVVAQLIELQKNPTLYGSPPPLNVSTNFCHWRPNCELRASGKSVEVVEVVSTSASLLCSLSAALAFDAIQDSSRRQYNIILSKPSIQ